MAFATEIEKQNTAQFETVLDTSFNGIVKVNMDGNIIVVNKLVEKLIGKEKKMWSDVRLPKYFHRLIWILWDGS